MVLLTGGPGMGKGRLLRAVRDRFATKVPVIYLDCGAPKYTEQPEPEPGARSAATEALADIAERLWEWKGTGGPFAFPDSSPAWRSSRPALRTAPRGSHDGGRTVRSWPRSGVSAA
ncbi:hypothetical protein NKH18_34885 [Streptomyces sp. M10(2022)]